MIIHLGASLLARSSGYPGLWEWDPPGLASGPCSPCIRWGLPCELCHHSPGELLPHHFNLTEQVRRSIFCGTFPEVALGRCYRPPVPVMPGLSSRGANPPAIIPEGRKLAIMLLPRRLLRSDRDRGFAGSSGRSGGFRLVGPRCRAERGWPCSSLRNGRRVRRRWRGLDGGYG